jgi:electron transfer flavoprotein beta subunit
MKARQKPIAAVTPDELGIDVAPRLETLKVMEPPKRTAGKKVPDVAALVTALKSEAGVI